MREGETAQAAKSGAAARTMGAMDKTQSEKNEEVGGTCVGMCNPEGGVFLFGVEMCTY